MAETSTGDEVARAFIAASEEGEFPEDLLADGFSAWTILQGDLAGDDYRHAIRLMARMTDKSLRFTVHTITSQDDRVLIEASSTASLIDGNDYANDYVFSLRLAEGRIVRVKEYFNALVVRKKLVPLMASMPD